MCWQVKNNQLKCKKLGEEARAALRENEVLSWQNKGSRVVVQIKCNTTEIYIYVQEIKFNVINMES